MFISKKRLNVIKNESYSAGYFASHDEIALSYETGYNKGKTEGIELAKRAFAKALKKKQTGDNTNANILRRD